MFSMAVFFRGGGFKAPMGEGMEGIRRAKGWVGHGGGGSPLFGTGGGLVPVVMFDVGHRRGGI